MEKTLRHRGPVDRSALVQVARDPLQSSQDTDHIKRISAPDIDKTDNGKRKVFVAQPFGIPGYLRKSR